VRAKFAPFARRFNFQRTLASLAGKDLKARPIASTGATPFAFVRVCKTFSNFSVLLEQSTDLCSSSKCDVVQSWEARLSRYMLRLSEGHMRHVMPGQHW